MFSIKTDRPKAFNIYLMGKIKADLNKSAFFFLPIFIFRGKKYSVKGCINSIYLEKDKIAFKEVIPIKSLYFNHRHLYWKTVLDHYQNNIDYYYIKWAGGMPL